MAAPRVCKDKNGEQNVAPRRWVLKFERQQAEVRFARDSPLEEAGFEPSVPRDTTIFECRLGLIPRRPKKSARKRTGTRRTGGIPAGPMVRILLPPAKSLRARESDRIAATPGRGSGAVLERVLGRRLHKPCRSGASGRPNHIHADRYWASLRRPTGRQGPAGSRSVPPRHEPG